VEVPLFLRWHGQVKAGSKDPRLVGNVDIAPTVLSAAGIAPDPAKPPLDGHSLLSSGRRSRILLEYWKEPGRPVPTWASVRTRRYQYVEYYRSDGRRFFREYYNLVHDRWQLRNLLADRSAANDPNVGALQARLAADRLCAGRQGASGPCP
jgi:arylsulfatase A-like enzyme